MTDTRVQRRLATILVADVVSDGRLVGADEVGTLAAHKDWRKRILEPAPTANRI
jgi:adenylate cyclase